MILESYKSLKKRKNSKILKNSQKRPKKGDTPLWVDYVISPLFTPVLKIFLIF